MDVVQNPRRRPIRYGIGSRAERDGAPTRRYTSRILRAASADCRQLHRRGPAMHWAVGAQRLRGRPESGCSWLAAEKSRIPRETLYLGSAAPTSTTASVHENFVSRGFLCSAASSGERNKASAAYFQAMTGSTPGPPHTCWLCRRKAPASLGVRALSRSASNRHRRRFGWPMNQLMSTTSGKSQAVQATVQGAQRLRGQPRSRASRGQSKPGPGSRLRPGATCSCPAISRTG